MLRTYHIHLSDRNEDSVDLTRFTTVEARSPRDCVPLAFRPGAYYPYGKLYLTVVPSNAPKHPNGMPMTCTVLELNYGPDDREGK